MKKNPQRKQEHVTAGSELLKVNWVLDTYPELLKILS